MENKVLLLDDLGKKYGETHVYYNLKTPAEALKLLCINYPEFAKDLATSHEQGIFYKVQQVDIDLELSDLFLPLGSHDLVITPVISGSGNVGKIALGALMVGVGMATGGISFASFFNPAAIPFAPGFASAGFITKATIAIGGSLVVGGVSNIIAPQPTPSFMDTEGSFTNFTSGPASLSKGADGTQTFAYTGATNSTGLGKTIPVAYGKVLIGSLLIGAQIEPDGEDNNSKKKYFREPSVGTFTLNGDKTTKGFRDCGGLVAKHVHKPVRSKIKAKGQGKRYNGTKTLSLGSDSEQHITPSSIVKGSLSSIKGTKYVGDGFPTKKFCIAFSIAGLIDRVADKNSTEIDGFITFQVIIKEQSSNDVVGQHQMTIQGLMKKGQKRLFIAKLPYSFITDKDRYQVYIKIINIAVTKSECTFKVENLGYNFS
tara:strand:+ start:1894 stop:3177 length:1284 start_codon:yes stop_codon:yes gene_type:complete